MSLSLAIVSLLAAQSLESQIVAPNDNPVSGVVDYSITTRSPVIGGDYVITTHDGDNEIFGFSFENKGTNAIIPSPYQIGEGPERQYEWSFEGRSRQDIQMHVTDVPDSSLSNLMESYIYLFPRNNLPAIQWPEANNPDQSQFKVILPTGEAVVFDTHSKMIVGGVMKETRAIDQNPNRFNRKFADLSYSGTGVMVRLDKRGNDPRLRNTATITFGTKKCVLPSSLLFNQDESSAVQFLFPTDEGFNTLLKNKCRFSFL